MSANSFADIGLINRGVKNGCVVSNIGVYNNRFTMIPVYEDNCDSGYYYDDDLSECELCPPNYYCPGNNLSILCPNGMVAPSGSKAAGNCGIMMHIDDDVLYLSQERQTSPALAVRVNGIIYYAELTPGARNMNINAATSLRVKIDGTEYSIHDVTINGGE